MANNIRGNKMYIDATGTLTTQRVLVAYIVFCPDAANDEMTLRETSGDVDIMHIHASTAKNTVVHDFSANPLVFNNGIHVQALSTNAKAMIITTNRGKE